MTAADHLSQAQLGPWYHGSAHQFEPGQELSVKEANRQRLYSVTSRRHLYFTNRKRNAFDYATGAASERGAEGMEEARPHVYQVELGEGHKSRDEEPQAFRTTGPLKIVRELGEKDLHPDDWAVLKDWS